MASWWLFFYRFVWRLFWCWLGWFWNDRSNFPRRRDCVEYYPVKDFVWNRCFISFIIFSTSLHVFALVIFSISFTQVGTQSRLYWRGTCFIGKASDIYEFQRRIGSYYIFILTLIFCNLIQQALVKVSGLTINIELVIRDCVGVLSMLFNVDY